MFNTVKIKAHVFFKITAILKPLYLVMSWGLSQVHHLRLQKLLTISHFGKEAGLQKANHSVKADVF